MSDRVRIEMDWSEFVSLYMDAEPGTLLYRILENKANAIADRELYHTAYKDGKATEEEKEKARREYLTRRGIPFH